MTIGTTAVATIAPRVLRLSLMILFLPFGIRIYLEYDWLREP